MNITLLKAVRIAGAVQAAGTTLDVDDALGASLVHRGDATNNRPHTEPVPVMAETNPLTGGIGIIGPDGAQVAGNAAPYAFTTRALAQTDNGMVLVCASPQTATVNASMPVGFGVAFKGAISFTAGSGVTITDVRTSGATNPWCALVQTAANTYDVVGTKA